MAYNLLSGTVIASQKYLPGDLIVENIVSGSFKGDGSNIEYVPRVSNAADNGIITNVAGNANTLTCESNLTFDGSLLNITGDLTASVGISASYFLGDGSNLTGVSAGNVSGSARIYSTTGVETSGYLKVTGSTTLAGTGSVSSIVATGSISGSSTLEAAGATILGSTLYVSGNVGIGTDSPTYALDVAGNAGFDEFLYHNGDTNTFIQFVPDRIYMEAGGENMLYLVSGSGGAQDAKVTVNNDGADVDFQVKGTDWPNLLRTDAVEGRVGIGMAADSLPTHTLTVVGAISASSTLAVVGAVSSSGDLAVSGNVHASVYYGDGSNLTGISAGNVSGSARVYSITGIETSGFLKVTGSAYLSGGVAYSRRTLSAVATASSADYFLGLDSTGGAFAIELADAAVLTNGQTVVLKDEGGDANSNNITVFASASQTIDGQNSIVLDSPNASIQLYCNGVDKYYIF